jgi:hypothetical protein
MEAEEEMTAGVTSSAHIGMVAMTALRYAQADAGEIVVPVRPAQLIAANFRHIQLRPDSRLEDGVPLYKLKILDALIDHLSQKNQPPRVDSTSIDSMIGELQKASRTPGESGQNYRAAFLPPPGAFVDLLA